MKTILSLFDYSGNWSQPYRDAGYNVFQVDLQLGIDLMEWDYKPYVNVVGIIAACPCTDFSKAGARLWKAKDLDGRTKKSIDLVRRTLQIINYHRPSFWAIENPAGRIEKCVPELRGKRLLKFHPYEFGDNYSKLTYLWGDFNPFLVRSAIQKNELGDITTKSWSGAGRSNTPKGFAKAFFEANN